MSYHVIDGCPVHEQQVRLLTEARKRGAAPLNSVYRGDDALALLHANGKHSQRELYVMLGPGVANPPGRSTHELFSDGVPYAGPIGRRLKGWQCGIDLGSDSGEAVAELDRITRALCGVRISRPYPSGREGHHGNPKNPPPADWLHPGPPVLRVGSVSKYVGYLTVKLSFIPTPRSGTYLHGKTVHYTVHIRDAVRAFQRDHGLAADGVAGALTYHRVNQYFEYWKRHRLKRAAWVRRGDPDR